MMYFINYSKCGSCFQKKSVASQKGLRKNVCSDCDQEFYNSVAENQKSYFLNGRNKNARNR